ncbi:monocarboxylate transporter 12-like [Physella acuta]|uniref:monocarboxylate transporter 12-like n=1 Tax=Physella acuta TaxID=109671 RepID=UPI0027DE158F|nr:monocarboxylate transporter 12-like [Physella acuta]
MSYGWVIVLSSFLVSLIVDGLTYTFGVCLGEFERAFSAPKSTIALASSLQVGIYLLLGPVYSAVTNRFGCRKVIIIGSIIAGISFIVSSWSNGVTMLILIYGVIGGFGFGMMYLPAVVAVSVYFEKKRALATGIAVCGSGIGTFILAPVTEILLNEYGWRWTLMILGAIILNGIVAGGLVRPLEMKSSSEEKAVSDKKKKKLGAVNGDKKEAMPLITVTDEEANTKVFGAKKTQDRLMVQDANVLSNSTPNIVIEVSDLKEEVLYKRNRANSTQSGTLISDDKPRQRSNTLDAAKLSSTAVDKPVGGATSHKSLSHAPLGLSYVSISDMQLNKIRDQVQVTLSRKDLHLAGSLADGLEVNLRQGGERLVVQSIKSLSSEGSTILYEENEEKKGGFWKCLPESARETVEEMLNLDILKNKSFWFVLLGNFFCMIGFYVPFVYVPERALKIGIGPEESAFLLSIIGITNTVGRVATGVIINFVNIKSVMVTSVALCLCGVMTIVFPFCHNYGSLAAVAAIFGLCVAAYISLCSIILCELLGVENLTNAFGYVILFRGIACIIGPPMAGAIIDAMGVFDPAFFVGGGMIVLGGLSHFVLYAPCIKPKKS